MIFTLVISTVNYVLVVIIVVMPKFPTKSAGVDLTYCSCGFSAL